MTLGLSARHHNKTTPIWGGLTKERFELSLMALFSCFLLTGRLKSYQMNFTETILRKVDLSNLNDTLGKNGSEINSKGEKINQETDLKATPKVTRSSTDDAKEATAEAKYSPWGWVSDFLGAFYGVVVFVVLMITCWLAREEYLRRNKGEDGSGRCVK